MNECNIWKKTDLIFDYSSTKASSFMPMFGWQASFNNFSGKTHLTLCTSYEAQLQQKIASSQDMIEVNLVEPANQAVYDKHSACQ